MATNPLGTTRALASKRPEDKALIPQTPEERAFDLIQRKATLFSQSDLVPSEYRGKIGNCVIAMNIASRMDLDVLEVMNNLAIIKGRSRWSGAYTTTLINRANVIEDRLQFRHDGVEDEYGCTAYGVAVGTGKTLEARVDWNMVKGEGWNKRDGSKWKTMADQMFGYRAATFFARRHCPEVLFGFPTEGEREDVDAVNAKWSSVPSLEGDIDEDLESDLDSDTIEPTPAPPSGESKPPQAASAEKAEQKDASTSDAGGSGTPPLESMDEMDVTEAQITEFERLFEKKDPYSTRTFSSQTLQIIKRKYDAIDVDELTEAQATDTLAWLKAKAGEDVE